MKYFKVFFVKLNGLHMHILDGNHLVKSIADFKLANQQNNNIWLHRQRFYILQDIPIVFKI